MEALIVKVTQLMCEQYSLKPKEEGFMYRRPYPDWVEQAPLPSRYKLTATQFSRQDNVANVEHISKYVAQLGEALAHKALKIRFFPTVSIWIVFPWFASLPTSSI